MFSSFLLAAVGSLLWWGQLVTGPLWAQELSFEHLLEIARTHTDSDKQAFLPNVSLGSAFSSLLCLPYRTTCLSAYLYPLHTGCGFISGVLV